MPRSIEHPFLEIRLVDILFISLSFCIRGAGGNDERFHVHFLTFFFYIFIASYSCLSVKN